MFDKLAEETAELKENLKEYPQPGPRPGGRGAAGLRGAGVYEDLRARLEDEVGDLFFVLVNIARYLSLDPESALKKANRKFKRRFQWLEQELRASGRKLEETGLDELESLWQKSKQHERQAQPPQDAPQR